MNNLNGKDLISKFRECIEKANNESDAETLIIKFNFKDCHGPIGTFVIKRVFFDFYLKNVSLWYFDDNGKVAPDKDIVINILLHNMHYDYFNLIDTEVINGKPECCGHGEYFKTDRYTFTFYRFPDNEDEKK